MHQATFDLAPPVAAAADRTGFDIGWDHAHHGLVPAAELLHPDTPVGQGWMAGKAVFGRRTLATTRATRQWLQLRTQAWRQGVAFDGQQLTPNYLSQLQASQCPVLRVPLSGIATQADTAVVECIDPQAGFAAGNLVTVSRQVALAWAGMDAAQAVRRARAVGAGARIAGAHAELGPDGLDTAAWWRLAVLRSFAMPLPFAEAARLPLALLPLNGVRVLNAPQRLQVVVTTMFTAPGWAARCRGLTELLAEPALRHDFNFFVGALAPRVLEAGSEPHALRRALEDAWLQDRVQRRWQCFVLGLGEAATEHLLKRIAAASPAGRRKLRSRAELATEGRALAEHERAPRRHTDPLSVAPRHAPPRPQLAC